MKKMVVSCISIISAVILLGVTCKMVEETTGTGQGIEGLRLAATDMSPWAETASEGYIAFNTSNMTTLVNGGADEYINKGLVSGFQQKMANGTKSVKIWVIDFGTAGNANNMYTKKDTDISDKSAAGSYALTVAEIDNEPIDGVKAYAHFGKYYFELEFTIADKSEAKTTAANFIEVFEAKIDALK